VLEMGRKSETQCGKEH